jgi:hypothetical protein
MQFEHEAKGVMQTILSTSLVLLGFLVVCPFLTILLDVFTK